MKLRIKMMVSKKIRKNYDLKGKDTWRYKEDILNNAGKLKRRLNIYAKTPFDAFNEKIHVTKWYTTRYKSGEIS